MTYLGKLACGNFINRDIVIERIYDDLFKKIEVYEKNLFELLEVSDEKITLFAPYLGRAILETTCTALLGRIDPFRILFIDKVQSFDSYEDSERTENSILWSGDIMQKDPPNKSNMWSQTVDFDKKVKRALIGDYYEELFWKKAFKELIDDEECAEVIRDNDFLQGSTSEDFIPKVKTKIKNLYSAFSKVVHGEKIGINLSDDIYTVKNQINELFKLLSSLLIVFNYIEIIQLKIEKENIFEEYSRLKERIEGNE